MWNSWCHCAVYPENKSRMKQLEYKCKYLTLCTSMQLYFLQLHQHITCTLSVYAANSVAWIWPTIWILKYLITKIGFGRLLVFKGNFILWKKFIALLYIIPLFPRKVIAHCTGTLGSISLLWKACRKIFSHNHVQQQYSPILPPQVATLIMLCI